MGTMRKYQLMRGTCNICGFNGEVFLPYKAGQIVEVFVDCPNPFRKCSGHLHYVRHGRLRDKPKAQ